MVQWICYIAVINLSIGGLALRGNSSPDKGIIIIKARIGVK